MVTFITGGARSGKSSFAMKRAREQADHPVYIATAGAQDAEFGERIERHKRERGDEWVVYEQYMEMDTLPLGGKTVVVDCITLWLSNLFSEYRQVENTLEHFRKDFSRLVQLEADLLLISNEIGMGVHAGTEAGRRFVDLHGWANQFVASEADEVICMISGLPLYLKKSGAS